MFWRRNRPRNRRKEGGGWSLGLPAINLRRLLPAGAVLLLFVAAIFGVRFAIDQPIARVDVTGPFQRVQQLDVHNLVRDVVRHHGMVGVDLQAVSEAVQQNPWVDRASVARLWPHALHVYVVEQVPVARWGEAGLLNARGEVFVRDSRHLPAELPEFAGPTGNEAQMTERYLVAQPRLVKAGLRLSRLRLDERGAWEIELDNGVALRLGRQQFDERFDRFIEAAAHIVATRAAEIRYVDLRYANGFAIGWRPAAVEVNRG
ncbi:MAG: cell division protein FtsQ/DivIB [Pseudomonadota bacterium]